MSKRILQQIAQLRGLSDMILQTRLSALQAAGQARAQTQLQLQALAAPKPAVMDDCPASAPMEQFSMIA